MLDINKNRVTASAFVTEREVLQGRYPHEDLLRRQLAERLSHEIVRNRMVRILHPESHSTEFRMEVYVLSPEELSAIIAKHVGRAVGSYAPSPPSWDEE